MKKFTILALAVSAALALPVMAVTPQSATIGPTAEQAGVKPKVAKLEVVKETPAKKAQAKKRVGQAKLKAKKGAAKDAPKAPAVAPVK